MHQLRDPRTWAGSAVITAVLLAIAAWRALPGHVPGWGLLGVAWLGGTVAVHLLLHNRWMRALDVRCHAVLSARRSRSATDARAAAAPRRVTSAASRGPAHATHRSSGRLADVLPARRTVERPELLLLEPAPVHALPPLRPVGPARAGSRYHHTGRSARSRPRAGRAA